MSSQRRPLWETLQAALSPDAMRQIIREPQAEVILHGTAFKVRKGGDLNSVGEPEAILLVAKHTNIAEHTKEDVNGFYRRITVMSGRRSTQRLYNPADEMLQPIEVPTWLQPRLTLNEQTLLAKRGYCWDNIK